MAAGDPNGRFAHAQAPQPFNFLVSFTNPGAHTNDTELRAAVQAGVASAAGVSSSQVGGVSAYASVSVSVFYKFPTVVAQSVQTALQSSLSSGACSAVFAQGKVSVGGSGTVQLNVTVASEGAATPISTMAQASAIADTLSLNATSSAAAQTLLACLLNASGVANPPELSPQPLPIVGVFMRSTVAPIAGQSRTDVPAGSGCLDSALAGNNLNNLATTCFSSLLQPPPAAGGGPAAPPYNNRLPDKQDVDPATLLALEICVGLAGGLLICCLVALFFQLRRRQRAAAAVAWVKDKQTLELADLAPQESTRIEGLLDMLEKDDEQREIRNKAAFEKRQAELLAAAAAARNAEAERARAAEEAARQAEYEADMRRRGYGGRGGRGRGFPLPGRGGAGRGYPPPPAAGRGGITRAGSLNDDMRAIQGPGVFAPVSPGRGPGGPSRPSPVPYGGARR